MTLYDKLLPEAKAGLKSNKSLYKTSVDVVTVALKANTSWLNLTVLQVSQIIMFTDIKWAKITKDTFQFGVNLIDQEI